MVSIVCHIVGMNNKIKDDFINNFIKNNKDVHICDLDKITNQIRNSRKMINLNKELDKIKKSSAKRKQLIKTLNDHWKSSLNKKLDAIFQNNKNKKIILLGLSSFHRNHRVKIKVDTNNKFFVKVNIKQNAKDIVEYNLNKYKEYIIDGSFPIRYLDHEFLMKQRERLIKIYTNMDYKLKTIGALEKWISLKLEINNEDQNGGNISINNILSEYIDDNFIYISSKKEYTEEIVTKTKIRRKSRIDLENLFGKKADSIYGYDLKWLSLISTLPERDKYIRRGFLDYGERMIPFIEEKKENAFELLNNPCYIYKVKRTDFENRIGRYKWKTDKNVKIIKKEFIPSILKELKNCGVKMLKLKY